MDPENLPQKKKEKNKAATAALVALNKTWELVQI